MRRSCLIVLLPALALVAGCGKKDTGPKGPFVPLVQRLPVDAPLVVMVDISRLFKIVDQAEQELERLPLLARHPALRELVEGQIATGRASLQMLQGTLGIDPAKDLRRAALAMMLPPDGSMELVAVVAGEFPPDFFTRVLPGAKPEKIAGQDVYPSPGKAKLALVDGRFLIAASPGLMEAALSPKRDAAEKLVALHPDLFKAGAEDTLLRVSAQLPASVASQIKLVPGLGVFAGVEQVYLDVGKGVELAAICADDETVDHVRTVFEAEAEMLAGGQHLLRGLGYWLLTLDLDGPDALHDLPPALASALSDREALLATLEALLPEPAGVPAVTLEGRRVALVTETKMLKGAGLLVGLGAAIVIPATIARERAAAEAEAEKIRQEAQRFDQRGGVQ